MTIRILLLLAALAPSLNVSGDIAPNPIQAKGIFPPANVDIVLLWERVVVDLYKDSSVVECQFFLKNEGRNQKINIGFPEMYFYHSRNNPGQHASSFTVHENGKQISNIELYNPVNPGDPDSADFVPAGLIQSNKESYNQKPWLLWDSQFDEKETRLITVRYSLPNGIIRQRCSYFTYLLSTGSGWKGNIESAEITVNLKDIQSELVLHSSPSGYTPDKNQLKWTFSDFEPGTEHDIKIFYEPSRGYYEKMVAEYPYPIYIIDGRKATGGDIFDQTGNEFRLMKPEDLIWISILKEPEEIAKYTSGNEPVILVTTKDYVIRQFVDLPISKRIDSGSVIAMSHAEFIKKYDLVIDGVHYADQEMLKQLRIISSDKIRRVILIKNDGDRSTINIISKKNKLIQ